MPFSRIKDPVTPEELTLLQTVFDETCAENDIPKIGPDAEALALILVRQLQNGLKDKDALRAVAQNLLKHTDS